MSVVGGDTIHWVYTGFQGVEVAHNFNGVSVGSSVGINPSQSALRGDSYSLLFSQKDIQARSCWVLVTGTTWRFYAFDLAFELLENQHHLSISEDRCRITLWLIILRS